MIMWLRKLGTRTSARFWVIAGAALPAEGEGVRPVRAELLCAAHGNESGAAGGGCEGVSQHPRCPSPFHAKPSWGRAALPTSAFISTVASLSTSRMTTL